MAVPTLKQVVLDTEDARALAEFYRELLGLEYRPGDEPHEGETHADTDWLALRFPGGGPELTFQQVDSLPAPTWPDGPRPQMAHLDLTVPTAEELQSQRDRALALGASILRDRFDDPEEPLYVFADPSGHPFCIFVG
ncbi:glyoxalase [Cnuibacter physcomitrellae]|uniref:Glyoxalase n=1 Tax=Cnuibacter physcomitrellae TaxID=1619308 RepID=A0A1X9LLS8_9MICO|nr:VOC family protein [Cnuibacter physcomitrellae]ARJ04059.1 glyoxalase [Cnuibacter physcomitrellae]MCS5497205.1 VOC family protein [Cnuibacter physcomitrellae]GGI40140.1 glyoxalase [Cnuibacter physcomitrellae]